MQQPAIVCRKDDPCAEAARLLWEHDVGALPVVGQEGHVVGMVTDRDLCMAAYTQGERLEDIPVHRAMAHGVYTITPNDPACLALRMMTDHRVRRLPVVDDEGRAVGLVSLNDLVRHAALSRRGSDAEYEVVQAHASICQPRGVRASSAPAMPSVPRIQYVSL